MNRFNTRSVGAHTPASALLACGAAVLLLAGCSDPSEDVYKSPASAGVEPVSKAPANAKAYVIAPESTITFTGSKVTGSHGGGFKQFTGTIQVADGKVVGSSAIEIQMDSTYSDSERLTGHLKSPDFFDVAQFPSASFTVTGVESSEGTHQVTGNLDLHGVVKSISFPAEIQVGGDGVVVRAEFAINRRDFKINYPGKPNDLIRDNVVIKLEILTKPA